MALELPGLLLKLLTEAVAVSVVSSCGAGSWPFRSYNGVGLPHTAVVSPLNNNNNINIHLKGALSVKRSKCFTDTSTQCTSNNRI